MLLLLNVLLYVIGETVTAQAWKHPAYDYSDHFISDLGAIACGDSRSGRQCSPLHLLMNTTFVVLGVVLFIASLLLARLLEHRAWLHILFAALFAIGMAGVGLVPNSAESAANGTATIHVAGACLAIISGNVMAVVAGAQSRRAGAPHWYWVTSLAPGAIGLAAFLDLAVVEVPAPGAVFERIAVYAILAWWLVTGLSLFVRTLAMPGLDQRNPP